MRLSSERDIRTRSMTEEPPGWKDVKEFRDGGEWYKVPLRIGTETARESTRERRQLRISPVADISGARFGLGCTSLFLGPR